MDTDYKTIGNAGDEVMDQGKIVHVLKFVFPCDRRQNVASGGSRFCQEHFWMVKIT